MSIFKNWMKNKIIKEGLADGIDPSRNYQSNMDDQNSSNDYERNQRDLFKKVYEKYPEETLDFFHTMAQRGDQEIKNLLRKLDNRYSEKIKRGPEHAFNQKDELAPSLADSGFSNSAEQE